MVEITDYVMYRGFFSPLNFGGTEWELQGCVEASECEWAARRSGRQTVVRDKQMKALGMAGGREIDPSKSTDSLCDIWCLPHKKEIQRKMVNKS